MRKDNGTFGDAVVRVLHCHRTCVAGCAVLALIRVHDDHT